MNIKAISYFSGYFFISMLAILALSGCTAIIIASSSKVLYEASKRDLWRGPAINGDTEAMYRLGKSYCCGYGPVLDNSKATKWLCKAARMGHAGAQIEIGKIYQRNKGVAMPITVINRSTIPSSNIIAYVWFLVASASGSKEAKAHLEEISKSLTHREFQMGKNLIRFYKHLPCRIEESKERWLDTVR